MTKPKMPKRNTRSSSCGRLPTRESQTADPNSASSTEPMERVELPPKQRTGARKNVSDHPSNNFDNDSSLVNVNTPNNEGIRNEDSQTSEQLLEKTKRESRPKKQVGDNKGNSPSLSHETSTQDDPLPKSTLPTTKPEDPWFPAFQELQEIRKSMVTSAVFEQTSNLHTQQLADVAQRTSKLEADLDSTTTTVTDLGKEIITLKSIIAKQGDTICSLQQEKEAHSNSLKVVKEDFERKTQETIAQMNGLVQEQRDQITNFLDQTNVMKQGMMSEMDDKVEKVSQEVKQTSSDLKDQITQVSEDFKYDKLKSQARSNKLNLVITGLQEDSTKTPLASAKDFFSSTLKIKGLQLDVAYRLGSTPPPDSSYARPLVVRFPTVAHRDKVWYNKVEITEEDGQKIRISADLPRRLREDSQLLHRVQKAASKIPKYKSAVVKDYRFYLGGESYAPDDLEKLPELIRPSTLATPKSDAAIAFFSRHSVFSNHYISKFTIKGVTFSSIEQFLAYRKAKYAEQDELASQALDAQNPAEAKSILNRLKKYNPKKWYGKVPEILSESLREKFRQNQYIFEILINSRGLQLGEASKDTRWGIGMTITDPQVLDVTKWHPNGNLLGRTLMNVREEFRKQTSPHATPSKQGKKPAQRK